MTLRSFFFCFWGTVVRDLEKGAVGTRRRPKLGNA
jgi:hypothetical protein